MVECCTWCSHPASRALVDLRVRASLARFFQVLFHPMTANANEWLWDGWRDSATVLIPRASYLADEINLRDLLTNVPDSLVADMKHTLSQHANRFEVALEDDTEDEVHAVLVGARKLARQLIREQHLH